VISSNIASTIIVMTMVTTLITPSLLTFSIGHLSKTVKS
jgi:hypothetical protein